MEKKPVGWFLSAGNLVLIIPKDDESADQAIARVAAEHNFDPAQVNQGEPKEDVLKPPALSDAPDARKKKPRRPSDPGRIDPRGPHRALDNRFGERTVPPRRSEDHSGKSRDLL